MVVIQKGSKMRYKISFITNQGKVRKLNEDSLLIDEKIISNISLDKVYFVEMEKEKALFVVADGMGGHNKGEIASRFILKRLRDKKESINNKEELIKALKEIKKELDIIGTKEAFYNMGSVVSGVFFINNRALIFNIGDCRVYENTFGFANLLTTDHSMVYNLYKQGAIEFEEIKNHPKKNIVTSALIANSAQPLKEIYIKEKEIDKFGEFLICSDGVWESLETSEIEECFKEDEVVECLFKKVMAKEASDNLSMIYIKVENE